MEVTINTDHVAILLHNDLRDVCSKYATNTSDLYKAETHRINKIAYEFANIFDSLIPGWNRQEFIAKIQNDIKAWCEN